MSDAPDYEAIEARIRQAFDEGDMGGAASLALECYGAELFGFLIARTRNAADADEVFSIFSEDLWRGIASFGWRGSMRGWAYALARNAANRYYSRGPRRRREQHLSAADHSRMTGLVAQIRSATRTFMRTETKSRMRELLGRLLPDDQALLMLRVDRGLPWREVALVLRGQLDDEGVDEAELEREVVRLRQRMSEAKRRLKRMAQREGLLE